MKRLFTLIGVLFFINVSAQQDTINLKILEHAPSLHKGRTIGVSATGAVLYGGSLIMLNEAWYKDVPKEPFHFHNDNNNWLQVDKYGHAYTAYFQGNWGIQLYKWAGLNHKSATWIGGSIGFLNQTVIEILDSQSADWGWSNGDVIANTAGTALLIGQGLLWDEQRIQMKFGYTRPDYSVYPTNVQDVVLSEFGEGGEAFFKDYNAHTYWLSTNIHSWLPDDSKFPDWINIAVGTSGDQMFHANDNLNNNIADFQRRRQFYLSPDIDFTKIKTNSRFVKTFLFLLNGFKLPAPALEYRSDGKTRFVPLKW